MQRYVKTIETRPDTSSPDGVKGRAGYNVHLGLIEFDSANMPVLDAHGRIPIQTIRGLRFASHDAEIQPVL